MTSRENLLPSFGRVIGVPGVNGDEKAVELFETPSSARSVVQGLSVWNEVACAAVKAADSSLKPPSWNTVSEAKESLANMNENELVGSSDVSWNVLSIATVVRRR
jgi:hypothetical protein